MMNPERDDEIERLRELLPPGSTVFCILRHTARSGMSRVIDLYKIENNKPINLGVRAAKIMGSRYDQTHAGIFVSGAGMDMGFALVYDLANCLYPDGFGCLGAGRESACPSNDHANGDTYDTPHKHRDGGYALEHRWL